MKLQHFMTSPFQTIHLALEKINLNNKGFLIVVDEKEQTLGTLTDGDIRRAFLEGKTIQDNIEHIYHQDFSFITIEDSFDKIIEKFKSPKVNFLPIIDENYQLRNIITKKQFHYLLMEDFNFDIMFDFLSLDKNLIEHEIFNKPWGFFKTTFLNPFSRAKIIQVYPTGELSYQEHKKREEHWVVIKGQGILVIGETTKQIKAGDYVYIPKGCKHKISNPSKNDSLMISEVQLGEYFGEDDIIRYEDKYGRC